MKKAFYTKMRALSFIMVMLFTGNLFATTIVYVYDPGRSRPQDGAQPDTATTGKIFKDAGYTVQLYAIRDLSNSTQADKDTLNNADMVYIGRAVGSWNFQDANKDEWNAITAPIMTGNMWAIRNNRMNWFNTDGCGTDYASLDYVVEADILDETDEVFSIEGFETPMGWWIGPYDYPNVEDGGRGDVMAVISGTNFPVFVRFREGREFYTGAGSEPAGERVFFGMDADGGTDADGLQLYNYSAYTENAMKIFLNEVARITGGPGTAIDSKKVTPSSTIYLNPTTRNLVVEMNNLKKVEIMDITGKQVYSSAADNDKLSIDFGFAQKGIYVVRLSDGNNGFATKKIVRQ